MTVNEPMSDWMETVNWSQGKHCVVERFADAGARNTRLRFLRDVGFDDAIEYDLTSTTNAGDKKLCFCLYYTKEEGEDDATVDLSLLRRV